MLALMLATLPTKKFNTGTSTVSQCHVIKFTIFRGPSTKFDSGG